ncbi:MAG TPA: hypothetical protein PKZ68_02735, partial [Pseudomonadales bacterium]|nr:hypothetical protein [Pseudomonadales bacterium]
TIKKKQNAAISNPYDAIDQRNKPAALEPVISAECSHLAEDTGEPRVQVYSKKARALAVELRLDVPVRMADAEFLFCGERAYHMTLDTRNIDAKSKHYWPVLVLKKQLPPSQYRVLWRNGDRLESLGNIHFL